MRVANLCKLTASAASVVVLVVAVLVGVLGTTLFTKNGGVLQYLTSMRVGRGRPFVGGIPAVHEKAEWGYSLEKFSKLDLEGKTIIVTGANSGIGFAMAKNLAQRKATVSCRRPKACNEAAEKIKMETGTDVQPLPCDLSSFESILLFTDAVRKKHKELDSIILNAAVANIPYGVTTEGLEKQIGINHFGHFLLMNELLPLVKAAANYKGAATVVVVSSGAHFMSYPEGIYPNIEAMNDPALYDPYDAYGQSKLANVLFAQELDARMKESGLPVLVNTFSPGIVYTPAALGSLEMMLEGYPWFVKGSVMYLFEKVCWYPEDASLSGLYLAVGQQVLDKKITGKYFHPITQEVEPDPYSKNLTMRKQLWKLTQDYVDSTSKKFRA